MTVTKTPFLDRYTTNETQKIAELAHFYPIYGRDKEIESLIVSLLRRSKNNPVLVGEAGVGKTAIVEGLCQAILKGNVPKELKSVNVRSLELASLMGQDEGFIPTFKAILQEAMATKGENLLFIDEFHTVVGTGGSERSALDAGNLLKPALARGDIQLIGATTLDEFHEYIETDRALERRMQPIMVEEPTQEEAIQILEAAKGAYERHHQLTITREAIRQAVHLSVRYIPSRFLPDKAFDIIDEAGAMVARKGQSCVTETSVATVFQETLGIPMTTLLKEERKSLLELEEKLKERVKGQEGAIEMVVNSLLIAQAGLQDLSKPLGSFLFLGTTGVGKTELAKALAQALFGDEGAMIRFDMSEYAQEGDAKKWIGDAQKRTKGQLTEKVKNKPYAVVLFDEIEKGAPEMYDLLLQVLDDGRLTDSSGRLVSFKHTVIIMTTNLGAPKIIKQTELKGPIDHLNDRDYKQFLASMMGELQSDFRPEFLNRIEGMVVFNLLDQAIIREIAQKHLDHLNQTLKARGFNLIYDDQLVDYLAELGTDIKNGARPLERFMKKHLLAPIAKTILPLKQEGYDLLVSIEGESPSPNHRFDKRTIKVLMNPKKDS
ncbi:MULTISPECIES: AAA family ATPase [Streptococcus]|uniref:AAA family ATPase n=1 Tax=Streptococcus TaxID=1301 RepID=UPI0002BA1CCA|nr:MULTISPECIES: ATP-dependent Clp protease ATP-binding subunit [Streptococcus]HEK9107959.1 ATP-dependent Clp protease ATP-binding subunit [Streptococcus equi subsp. zooepidemicus]EPT39301.1 ATP-dependent Clp protease ATP-binding protein [Streptococcus agalactiae FSL S3-501]MCB2830819.1 ATP-dependent Clp protease ATP-binding subunit [Streptococcus dysgalactiae subsp. dysgalactiae]MCB2836700.1 ATP-dependent Clp protease ATP-binding subunit [Streptococcus dysgalactiae subsp. dysgalactiae]MCB2838